MMRKISAEELLGKNPEAREVFEKNERKRARMGRKDRPKSAGYGLALPYGARKLVIDDRSKGEDKVRVSYQRG